MRTRRSISGRASRRISAPSISWSGCASNGAYGAIPISNFVTRVPAPKVGTLERVDGERVLEVAADVRDGVLPDDKVREIRAWLAEQQLDPSITATFKG